MDKGGPGGGVYKELAEDIITDDGCNTVLL